MKDWFVRPLRVPLPWGGERVDLTRLSDGRVMCCICFDYFPREDLWVDVSGIRWDMCRQCGDAEVLIEATCG